MGKKKEHILIVGDEERSRYLIRKVVENAGYSVTECQDVASGLKAAIQEVPHLIILDLVLPRDSVFEFLEKRKGLEELKGIPILVVSGLKDADSVQRASVLGAADYLTKPIDARILVHKLFKLLRNRKVGAYSFPRGSIPGVKVRATGKILMGNEVGFLLEVPLKIASEELVDVQSPILNKLGCCNAIFQKTSNPVRSWMQNQYINEVVIIGLNPVAVKRIREILKDWK